MQVKKKGVFRSPEDALDWLNNKMSGAAYGYKTLAPQQAADGDIALLSFKSAVYGESEITKVERKNDKVVDTIMGDFVPYNTPVVLNIGGKAREYALPHPPGEQFGYYDRRVLDDIRKLGRGGITWKSKTIDEATAKLIGTKNEKCVQKYEENIFHAKVANRAIENVGFDLESERPKESKRFIEVKTEGGYVELTENELRTARRLRKNYYLYIVGESSIRIIRDPASGKFAARTLGYHYVPDGWERRGNDIKYKCS